MSCWGSASLPCVSPQGSTGCPWDMARPQALSQAPAEACAALRLRPGFALLSPLSGAIPGPSYG